MPWLLVAALSLAAESDASEWPPAPRGAVREALPLYRPWRDFPKVFVEATLPDGSAGLFLVDTGSETSMLTRHAAERLALPVEEDVVRDAGLTAVATVDLAELPWLRLGDMVVPEVQVAVRVPGQPERYGFMSVDGVLGNDVWSRFVVELDLRADRLLLKRPGTVRLPRRAAPLTFRNGHPQVPVRLTTAAHPDRHHAFVLTVDTGATGLFLRGPDTADLQGDFTEGLEALHGLGIDPVLPPAAHLRVTRRILLDRVDLGGARLRPPTEARWIDFDQPLAAEGLTVEGWIGQDLLLGRRVVLDYAGGALLVAPSRRPARFRNGHARLLEREVAEHGAPPERALQRALLLLGLDQRDAARALLEQAATDIEDPTRRDEAVQARVVLARGRRAGGDPDGARHALAPLTAEELTDHEELVAVVNGLVLDGLPDPAWELVGRALSLRPDAPEAHVAHADLLVSQGRAEEAQAALLRASTLRQDLDAFLLRKVRVALARSDHDGALALLRAGIQADPRDGRLLWLYAQLARAEDLVTFRRDLERSTALLHPALRPLDFLAGAHATLGEPVRASAWMEQGIARDCAPMEDEARMDNCVAWHWALAGHRVHEAVHRVDRAVTRDPARSAYQNTRAVALLAIGEVEQAAVAARAAARLQPDNAYLLWQADRISAMMVRAAQDAAAQLGAKP